MAGERASHGWVGQVAMVVGLILLYYLIPLGDSRNPVRLTVSILLFIAGVALLTLVFARRTLRMMRGEPARIRDLLLLLYIATTFFALSHYVIATSSPEQFAQLNTRTDALYFTMATIATVGFGDVHAQGQLARAFVTVNIAFNLVILASLVGSFRRAFKQ
ncbi:potassium channel family protein [Rhizohabitans arisaemae]|uniref:potassium channel family protein n=1 Tax=Rhizohabitans arisaemae TaxID=2720610 RepID=UPI0024B0DB64|nr:potassium channel family protein [Rhizohabitans arisaemae]